ncbi:putative MFS family arabinose efflux permease [Antricoccus suffuscus]|uniref:Putative MFS family arabinose efflux permease n=1 Tax=Antricoccus suffuscus TaxID=1629062 RepID=A0A2T1A4U2_9ACTN|nr:MFS transporter [Antricoccus suffuscus]PRZ43606.1 putative MFS family arabinose efflux permease [Antricoccus suffuscus]
MSKPTLGRSFWLLVGSTGLSNLSDGVRIVVLPLLATTLTRDPVAISVLSAIAFLPWLLFAIPSGAVVDRIDRSTAMAWSNFARTVVVGSLCGFIALDQISLVVLYVVALLLGIIETVYDSAARASLPEVVEKKDLERGNAWITAAENVMQTFIGPPLGAALFTFAVIAPFLLGAAGWFVSAVLILAVRTRRPQRAEKVRLSADIKVGMRWLWRHDFMRRYTLLCGLDSFVHALVSGLLVLFALETLRIGPSGVGLFFVGAGVGALVGSVLAPWLTRRVGRTNAQAGALIFVALTTLPMGLTHNAWVAGTLFSLTGTGVTVWNINSMSIRQALIPTHLFGRVQGGYRTLIWGLIPIGEVTGGFIGKHTSLSTVFVLCGVLGLATGALLWRLLFKHRHEIAAAYRDDSLVKS